MEYPIEWGMESPIEGGVESPVECSIEWVVESPIEWGIESLFWETVTSVHIHFHLIDWGIVSRSGQINSPTLKTEFTIAELIERFVC